jgi:hypothetical protein
VGPLNACLSHNKVGKRSRTIPSVTNQQSSSRESYLYLFVMFSENQTLVVEIRNEYRRIVSKDYLPIMV